MHTAATVLLLALLAPLASAQVLINEFNTGTPDWLELGNCTPSPVDISGWTLSLWYATSSTPTLTAEPGYTFPAGTIIPPFDYLIVQENGTPGAPGSLPQSISCGFNLYWTNARTHELLISDNLGVGIDYVYKNYFGNPPTPNIPPGLTWTGTLSTQGDDHHRLQDQDTDDASDWEILFSGAGTPAAINPGQVAGPTCGCPGTCTAPISLTPSVGGSPGFSSDVVTVDTASCTTDNETVSCGTGGDDALITFTAPFDGTAIADTCAAASFDTILAVLDGPCGVGSPELACNDDSPTCAPASEIVFPIVTGNDYTIVVDGVGGATGTADVTVTLAELGCALTGPAGTVSGDLTFSFDSFSGMPTVDLLFEYSTDAGATFSACTAALASPTPNPSPGVAPGPGGTFIWDSLGDGVGTPALQTGVLVRLSVDDGGGTPATCQAAAFDVDNPLCTTLCGDCDGNGLGPTVLDALVGAQISAGLVTPTLPQTGCCDVDLSSTITVLDALLMAQEAAGIAVTITCI